MTVRHRESGAAVLFYTLPFSRSPFESLKVRGSCFEGLRVRGFGEVFNPAPDPDKRFI